MRRRRQHPLLSFALCLLAATHAATQERAATEKAEATKVLLVGNSYTFYNEMPAMLRALGRADRPFREIETTMIAPGGCTWKRHSDDKGEQGVAATLRRERPDFVVLQEQSQMAFVDAEQMQKYAARLAKEARRRKAEPVWFQTWAREHQPERQREITAQYDRAREENGGRLAPVGAAFAALRAEASPPKLHQPDKSHPSPSGSYLAACVLYGALFGGDVTKLPDKLTLTAPDGSERVLIELDAALGERLRAAAAKALADERAARERPADERKQPRKQR